MVDYCVCAEPIEERGLYPCGHALCLNCTLKKRMLMKDNQCPYCRAPAKHVAVIVDATTDPTEAKIDFQPGNLKVQTKELVKSLRHILEYPCPQCDQEQRSYKALKAHAKAEHDRALCDVCTRHEYSFSDEYRLFEPEKIKEHLRSQHISCKYCRTYFYGIFEFSKHCKDTHMGCGICERRDPEHPLYFRTYEQLYDHYKEKHYMCMVPQCLEDKHIVFGTALELKRHMIEVHKGLINSSRQAQQIDLDQLNYDAEEAQNSTAHGPSLNEIESEKARYEARLEIAAEHDQEKIEKLRGANKTFMNKNVPVEIFIATYESVLGNASPNQITALLTSFKRTHKTQLSPEANRALGFKINLRNRAEIDAEEKEANARLAGRKNSDPTKQLPQLSSSQPNSRGPTPTAVSRINWGLNMSSGSGIGDMAALPKLGGSQNTAKAGGSSASTESTRSTWNATSSSRSPPITAMQNLPTLVKKKNPFQAPKPNPLSVRQTRIPLMDSRNSHSDFFASLRTRSSNSSPASTPSQPTPASSPSPSNSNSVTSSPALSPATSRPVSRQGSNGSTSLQMGSLPSLPKKEQTEKKRSRNVVRLV